jgi:hypothetical protein
MSDSTTIPAPPDTSAGDGSASLSTWEAKYKDLLRRLGCMSHDGAAAEIAALRIHCGLDKPNAQAHQTPERSEGGMVPPVVGTLDRKDGGR